MKRTYDRCDLGIQPLGKTKKGESARARQRWVGGNRRDDGLWDNTVEDSDKYAKKKRGETVEIYSLTAPRKYSLRRAALAEIRFAGS